MGAQARAQGLSGLPLVVVGPTAIGKSSVGLAVAQAVGGHLVSADSQLVYEGLNIGTAKPTVAEQALVPHHCMDLLPPTGVFSADSYKQAAVPVLDLLEQQGVPAVVVGGTGFYLRQVFEAQGGLPGVPANPELREQLVSWARQEALKQASLPTEAGQATEPDGLLPEDALPKNALPKNALPRQALASLLHQRLAQKDPKRAAELHPNNIQRVLRALEIVESTGYPVPEKASLSAVARPAVWVGLQPASRQWLWQVQEARLDAMLAEGWLEELQGLQQAYGANAHALQVAHGYPVLAKVLAGELSLQQAKQQIAIEVRQYSRRQWSWFSKNPAITWLTVDENSTVDALATETLRLWQAQVTSS